MSSCAFLKYLIKYTASVFKQRKKKTLHSWRLSGAVSYLGGHDAETHAIVLLQSYRDNLWLLPHWLKRERQKMQSDWRWNTDAFVSSLYETLKLVFGLCKMELELKNKKKQKRVGWKQGGNQWRRDEGNGENHRGTCGCWNLVKNEKSHHGYAHTRAHAQAHTYTHLSRAGLLGWVERKRQFYPSSLNHTVKRKL